MFGTVREKSEKAGFRRTEDTLHKAFVACTNFRGKDNNNLLQLFRVNLHEMYDKLYDLVVEHGNQPEDFYTSLSDATQTARDGQYADLDASHMLCLFKFYKIDKI